MFNYIILQFILAKTTLKVNLCGRIGIIFAKKFTFKAAKENAEALKCLRYNKARPVPENRAHYILCRK